MTHRTSTLRVVVLTVGTGTWLGCAGLLDLASIPRPLPEPEQPLRELRKQHRTTVAFDEVDTSPPPAPPDGVFELVTFEGPLGAHPAYVTPVRAGEPGAGIVWVAGGLDWGIGSWVWEPASRDNDQTASAFREAGLALMLPALRGSNGAPGHNECFFGEVEDILAAANALAARPDVDPERVYLGGHSTGGTLALLAAASSDRFRGVVSFGPIDDPRYYGPDACLPADASVPELQVRAPLLFVDEIQTPTWVIEGADGGNVDSLRSLQASSGTGKVLFVEVPGHDHFSVLRPASEVIAQKILGDIRPEVDWFVTPAELGQ